MHLESSKTEMPMTNYSFIGGRMQMARLKLWCRVENLRKVQREIPVWNGGRLIEQLLTRWVQ